MGLPLLAERHRSVRKGAFPERMRKLVYVPILPGRVTRICSRMPARRKRSKRRTRVSAVGSDSLRTGQPSPVHRTLTRAARGPRIDSSVMRAPRRAKNPRIRITGKGRRKAGAETEDAAVFVIVTVDVPGAGVVAGGSGGAPGAGGWSSVGVAATTLVGDVGTGLSLATEFASVTSAAMR